MKRNIILYVVDDQGMNDAGCYGHPLVRTPGLDYLARHGARFTHAFCSSPSCSASRSTILTGMHNHANGQYGHSHWHGCFRTFDSVKSLPAYLSGAGYRTMSAGKFHVAPKDVYAFDHFINFELGEYTFPPRMADAVAPFLSEKSDRPFFLYFCTREPHRDFPNEHADRISPDEVKTPSYLPDIPECRDELAQYFMSIQHADMGLQRLIHHLIESGHWHDTLIIYVSDNGAAFPGAKTCLYEPGIHLPCVIRDPFQKRHGHVNNALITWCDLTPSILEYAGITVANAPFASHGRSFYSILGEENPEGWDEIYASHSFHELTMYYPMRMVRNRKYKLILNIAHGLEFPHAIDLWESATWQGAMRRGLTHFGKRPMDAYLRRPKYELYDLENDPDETLNLAAAPLSATVFAELKQRLRTFQERTGDPWAIKYKHE